MTLNQIIKRIQEISLAHKQLRNFYYGLPSDFLEERTTLYASAFLQDVPGTIDITGNVTAFGFKLYCLDLVNVSEDSKANEQDVQSDMVSVLQDLIAEMDHSSYTDWKVSGSNTLTIVQEEFDDMVAGAVADIIISVPYLRDVCAVPTETLPGIINNDDMKFVYDETYIATGLEGTILSIPALVGKKILFAKRANNIIDKVSNLPASDEFTWNDTVITLGTPTSVAGEKFLFLYRNY